METTIENHSYVEKQEYGGFWIRFGAYLIDSIIIGIPLSVISIIIFILFFGTSDVFSSIMNDPTYLERELTEQEALSFMGTYFGALLVTSLISFITVVAYFAGLHASKWQGTLGKKMLGLKVTDLTGNRISFWRAFGRYLAMAFLSGILLIGYIIAAFTEKKQGLHDLIAGTLVVKK
ncbi:RDD family protein [Bacillus sp. V3B]|uniref:RDD family protein n=1 Tax=Bacillus sp. V3B TaxID=2804915 RepID=UPI0021098DC2|nr:RDD family protein [Bacillus sp. V3B]MCQ6275087.1 RDD family protein [Bacillus sp. V3B]